MFGLPSGFVALAIIIAVGIILVFVFASRCPSREKIKKYVGMVTIGKLEYKNSQSVGKHISSCTVCGRIAIEIENEMYDTLEKLVR